MVVVLEIGRLVSDRPGLQFNSDQSAILNASTECPVDRRETYTRAFSPKPLPDFVRRHRARCLLQDLQDLIVFFCLPCHARNGN